WWARNRASKEREKEVQAQRASTVDVDGGLSGKAGAVGGGVRAPGGGNYPVLAGGTSCEAARSRDIEDYDKSAPPDLPAGQFGQVLNNGSYVVGCGTPASMKVTVCAAIQNGRAVAVTVSTNPSDSKIASCIAGAVRRLSFPAHPRLDVTTTVF